MACCSLWLCATSVIRLKGDSAERILGRAHESGGGPLVADRLGAAMIEPKAELEQREELLGAVLEAMRDAVFLAKQDRIVFANGACLALLGATGPGQVLGRSPRSFLADDAALLANGAGELAGNGATPPVALRRIDERIVDAEATVTIFDAGAESATLVVLREIALGERAEERWRAGEAIYRQVVDVCLEGIWIHSAGQIVFANRPAARLFGAARPEDLIGRSAFDIVHPDDRPRAMARTMNMLDRFDPAPFTLMKFLGEGGRTITLEVQAVPFVHDGKSAVMAVGRDVTERIRTEQALRESEARFRSLSNSLPALLWMSDASGECTFVNKTWTDYTGRPLEDELGHGFVADIHPEDQIALAEQERTMFARKEPLNTEYRLRGKDGTYRWFVDHSVPRYAEDGRYLGHAGVLLDVNERHRLEAQITTIVESTVDGLITIDEDGTVLMFSGPAERIFGWKADEVLGRNIAMLMPEPDKSAHDGYLANYLHGGVAKVIGIGREVEGRRKDGTVFPMDLAVGELPIQEGRRGFIGTVRDISERKRLQDQLRQAQRMEAVGQLTGGVAHDFNNLLGVIIGNLDLALEQSGADERLRELIQAAIAGSLHGAELTKRLLAFSRKQPLQPRTVDLNHSLPHLEAILQRTLGEHIAVRIRPANDLWPCVVDPSQLNDAILNLAINARDAMPKGGMLTIETANAALDAYYTQQEFDVSPGDYVRLSVSDTGVGMTPAVIERVFEPFFTTKGTEKGTGLGLSMVYGFVKQSKGHIKIYSEVGIGTTIRIYFPRAGGPAKAGADAELPAAPPPRGSETILVVEDNPAMRRITVNQLTDLGYHVLQAENGVRALELLGQQPEIQLMFSDVVMPGGMTGYELAGESRRRHPALKILLTSGYASQTLLGIPPAGTGLELLHKPFRMRDLAVKLRQVLGSG
jgi:PAS domain S-box-containing protein